VAGHGQRFDRMNGDGPARLTGALLVKKGNATPASYGMQPISALVADSQRSRKMFAIFRRGGEKRSASLARPADVTETPVEVIEAPIEVIEAPVEVIEAPVEVAPAPAKARRRARKDSRARLTVRLEADTYLQLKLVSAHRRDSLQKVLTKAVEFYLDEISPSVCEKKCACLESGRLSKVPPGGCRLI
jgi:hypothetical protein